MEEEAVNIDWVSLVESLDGMDAEMARGYLETQGIPAEARLSKRGLNNYEGILTAWPFRQVDLYVPREALDSAILVLRDMPKVEPVIGDHEDFVLVYDEAGELQELDLSASGKCPACGEAGIAHKAAQKGKTGLLYLVWIALVPVAIILSWALMTLDVVSDPSVPIAICLGIAAMVSAYALQGGAESWYCKCCGQAWHK